MVLGFKINKRRFRLVLLWFWWFIVYALRVSSVFVMVFVVFNEWTRISSVFVMVLVVLSLCVRELSVFVIVLVVFNECVRVSSGFLIVLGFKINKRRFLLVL